MLEVMCFWYSKFKKIGKGWKILNFDQFQKPYNMVENWVPTSYMSKDNGLTSFGLAIFGSSTHIRRKIMTYLESWGNLDQRHVLYMQKYPFENVTLFGLALTWPPSKWGWMTSGGRMTITIKWPRRHMSHGMLVTFISQWLCVTWPWSYPS